MQLMHIHSETIVVLTGKFNWTSRVRTLGEWVMFILEILVKTEQGSPIPMKFFFNNLLIEESPATQKDDLFSLWLASCSHILGEENSRSGESDMSK